MAGSVNKVILVGNLGADPEVRQTQGGKVANMRLACSETWKDKNTGERREKTEWVSVVVWGDGIASVCENYLAKGSKVYIEGSLQTRKWEDQNGNERYSTEVVVTGFKGQIVLLDKPPQGEARGGGGERGGPYKSENSGERAGRGADGRRPRNNPAPDTAKEIDDEIPF